jgi:hypothetical protein
MEGGRTGRTYSTAFVCALEKLTVLKTLSSQQHEAAQPLPMTILSVTRASDDQVAFRDCLADVRYRILGANAVTL